MKPTPCFQVLWGDEWITPITVHGQREINRVRKIFILRADVIDRLGRRVTVDFKNKPFDSIVSWRIK